MGLDVSEPKKAIAKHDLEKMFDEYFIPGLARGDAEVLVQKVLLGLLYYTGKHGKEGLRALHQDQFTIKTTPEGKECVEINFNPTSKTNQGDHLSSSSDLLHNNKHVIFAQPGSVRCPVNSFKHCMEKKHTTKCCYIFSMPQ